MSVLLGFELTSPRVGFNVKCKFRLPSYFSTNDRTWPPVRAVIVTVSPSGSIAVSVQGPLARNSRRNRKDCARRRSSAACFGSGAGSHPAMHALPSTIFPVPLQAGHPADVFVLAVLRSDTH